MSRTAILDGFRRRPVRVPELSLDGAIVLEASGITVTYGARPVLADVDVTVRAGEVLALVGPNGAGKSTLLGVLSGDQAPGRGEVRVDGRPMHDWTPNELAIRRGVLLQQVDVSFPFTVTEVVRMGRAPWAGTLAEDFDDAVIADALVDAEITDLSERVYRTLSGGERSRAAYARVLAQEPVALLLDEPTASLDIRHQELVLGVARQRAVRGDAVVVVLHDLALAAAYADRIMILERGRVAADGTPADVLTAELLSRVWDYPIDVHTHPRTGAIVIQPDRPTPRSSARAAHPTNGGQR